MHTTQASHHMIDTALGELADMHAVSSDTATTTTSSNAGEIHDKRIKRLVTQYRKQMLAACKATHDTHWTCCNRTLHSMAEANRHISTHHSRELLRRAEQHVRELDTEQAERTQLLQEYQRHIDNAESDNDTCDHGVVLLFYRYCVIEDPDAAVKWVERQVLQHVLAGKIRIAHEGINGTVAGSANNTDAFMQAMIDDGRFHLQRSDFKSSVGPGRASFGSTGIRVHRVDELVPLAYRAPQPDHQQTLATTNARVAGVTVEQHGVVDTGRHISPSDFHHLVSEKLAGAPDTSDLVLVDCRNFYEIRVVDKTHTHTHTPKKG
jgi:hypothetical protein